jgi:hypothetical protein
MKPKGMYRRTLEVLKFTALLTLALVMLPLAAQAKGQGEPDGPWFLGGPGGQGGPGGPQKQEDCCKLIGSWYGWSNQYDVIYWLSTMSGQNSARGGVALEVPGFDVTLTVDGTPTFPDAVEMTTIRGVWERTSGNTFEYTGLSIASDADGLPVYIGKLTGTETLSEDCNSMFLEETYLQIFAPNADPFEDDPLFEPIPFPDHYGYRMNIDLPEIVEPSP